MSHLLQWIPEEWKLTWEIIHNRSHEKISHHASNGRQAVGLCTGALAVAVVSCSRSALELVTNGVTAIIVAFRTGLRVLDAARRVARVAAADDSWSIILPGSTSSEAVQRFCEHSVGGPFVLSSFSNI